MKGINPLLEARGSRALWARSGPPPERRLGNFLEVVASFCLGGLFICVLIYEKRFCGLLKIGAERRTALSSLRRAARALPRRAVARRSRPTIERTARTARQLDHSRARAIGFHRPRARDPASSACLVRRWSGAGAAFDLGARPNASRRLPSLYCSTDCLCRSGAATN